MNASGLVWQPCKACQLLFERGEHWTQQRMAPVFTLTPLEVYEKARAEVAKNRLPGTDRDRAAHESGVGQVFALGVDYARERQDNLLRELYECFEECRWEDGQELIKKALAAPRGQ